jgi:plasmid stabilization system protein ParE
MPEWTRKDRRMYEHIRDSAEERGADEEHAEEIAARTVNKRRREAGRTPNTRTMGTGNPNAPLEEHTVDELQNQAKALGITGRSKLKKAELISAIRDKQ